jgi:hypothetical protein
MDFDRIAYAGPLLTSLTHLTRCRDSSALQSEVEMLRARCVEQQSQISVQEKIIASLSTKASSESGSARGRVTGERESRSEAKGATAKSPKPQLGEREGEGAVEMRGSGNEDREGDSDEGPE